MSHIGVNIGALTVKVAALRGDTSSATRLRLKIFSTSCTTGSPTQMLEDAPRNHSDTGIIRG